MYNIIFIGIKMNVLKIDRKCEYRLTFNDYAFEKLS